MTLYRSYQELGGNEPWVPVRDGTDFEEIRPTFITVLACDTLLGKDSPKSMVEDAKYYGPMYFDLDDADDVANAISGAKALWAKLTAYGLTDQDVEIFLSGKKGLHFLVSPICFMEKQLPVSRLPAIYKEIAFKLAVDTLDFAVYSARRGRMFRTTYQVRENGNYKVPISPKELESLTPTTYTALCANSRPAQVKQPSFKPKFAIVYEEIAQKIKATKKAKAKPVDAATLGRHLPTVRKLMEGRGVREDVGFNKIAMQLAIYANEAKLTEDQLVSQCEGLVNKHTSDSYRYNTPSKRREELRRMFSYLEDNSGYDYALGPIRAMLKTAAETPSAEGEQEEGQGGGEETDEGDGSGLYVRGCSYYVASEQGDRHIMDAKFEETVVMLFPESGEIACINSKIRTTDKLSKVYLERSDFAASSSLHKAVSMHGVSFTGTDVHARHIYTHMLRESKASGTTVYATSREGLDLLKIPMCSIVEARDPFVVWSDANGVIVPETLRAKGLDIQFVGYPDPQGVLKTDLASAPTWPQWSAEPENRAKTLTMLRGLLNCQSASSVSKLLGWATACFYGALFRNAYGKFPLLHLNGAAGSGKTETLEGLMHMFYYKGEPLILNPSSTNFAITSAVTASASIPVIIDEYKPHKMNPVRLEELKAMFRSSYNGQTISKGGGNRTKDSFGAIHSVKLTGPVVFVAEAMEEETALLERCVLVTLRRPSGMMYRRYAPRFKEFKQGQELLAIIGQHIAANIVGSYSVGLLREEFEVIHENAKKKYLEHEGADSNEDSKADKEQFYSRPRVVYNHAVSEFGLSKFFEALQLMFDSPAETEELSKYHKQLTLGVYQGVEEVAKQTMPEYIKVLLVMSDMSRFKEETNHRLAHGVDFELSNIAEVPTLNIVGRLCFSKYKAYCRSIGDAPLFAGEGSFLHAIRDSDIFIKQGSGTKGLQQESLILDYEQLQRLKMPPFTK